jgi:hypothetical protein
MPVAFAAQTSELVRSFEAARQPSLVSQLLQVRLQRDAGGGTQVRRDLAPGGVEHLVERASALVERGEQAALAL